MLIHRAFAPLILLLAGCNMTRPVFTSVEALNTATNLSPEVRAEVDPNTTTVTAVTLEWGRRFPNQAVNLIYTDDYPLLYQINPELPQENPFSIRYVFNDGSWADPFAQGEIVDYQIRLTHTTDDGSEVYFWSPRNSFTMTGPVGGGGAPPAEECEGTQRVSIHTGPGSAEDTGESRSPAISSEGSIIAFETTQAFEANDTNNASDIYVHDLEAEETTRVSIYTGPGSTQDTGGSHAPEASADGSVIAFATTQAFDPTETNNASDIYIHDRNTSQTRRVSIHTGGGSMSDTGGSSNPSISEDGNVIAFETTQPFDANDNNDASDIYIHDLSTNQTRRVSVYTGSGSMADTGGSRNPSVSADGNAIAFESAQSFDSNDNNSASDIYVHVRDANQTRRVSVYTGGGSIQNSGGSVNPSISDDGNVIAFETPQSFESNDTNDEADVYIHDRAANQTQRVSVYTAGGSIQNAGGSRFPSISGDGRVIAFETTQSFESDDNNEAADVYVHDLDANQTRRVSIFTGSGSTSDPGGSGRPSISGDGSRVAFESSQSFESNDNNGAFDIYIHCE